MKHAIVFLAILLVPSAVIILAMRNPPPKPAPAKTETLTCVRVKEVTPAGTINYLCEVRK